MPRPDFLPEHSDLILGEIQPEAAVQNLFITRQVINSLLARPLRCDRRQHRAAQRDDPLRHEEMTYRRAVKAGSRERL